MIGKWVKQYRAGYWYVVDIKPKYADCDYSAENVSWKKGDLLGCWALMKKGFTAKMRFSLDSDYSDSSWLKPITSAEQEAIDLYFSEHPEQKAKFEAYPFSPKPGIVNLWLNLSEEKESAFNEAMDDLLPRFTGSDVSTLIKDFDAETTKPGEARYELNLMLFPWELTDGFDQIYIGSVLSRMK